MKQPSSELNKNLVFNQCFSDIYNDIRHLNSPSDILLLLPTIILTVEKLDNIGCKQNMPGKQKQTLVLEVIKHAVDVFVRDEEMKTQVLQIIDSQGEQVINNFVDLFNKSVNVFRKSCKLICTRSKRKTSLMKK